MVGLVQVSLKPILLQLAKGGHYSKRLKMHTLNRHKACLVWPKAMQLAYTRALTQEEDESG